MATTTISIWVFAPFFLIFVPIVFVSVELLYYLKVSSDMYQKLVFAIFYIPVGILAMSKVVSWADHMNFKGSLDSGRAMMKLLKIKDKLKALTDA